MKIELISLLQSNSDLFAWAPEDTLGIDPKIIFHKLAIDPKVRPLPQKKRKLIIEKQKVATQETVKLLMAGFIKEIHFATWLANMVMVPKSLGKWRMCVDFTYLDKACPKDACPLPSIDKLVDRASEAKFLSFMDVYYRYNQIKMHPIDEEKTTSIIENATYCYKVMPFGLKNAGAIY